MQTRTGQPAKGTTSAEFVGHMKQINKATETKWNTQEGKIEWHGQNDLIHSFDNPSIHEAAVPELQKMGVERAELPTYSTDMHKVIEHVHGYIGREFKARLLADATIVTSTKYVKLLKEIFYGMSKEVVAKDVASLPETYAEIVRLSGDWPNKKFR